MEAKPGQMIIVLCLFEYSKFRTAVFYNIYSSVIQGIMELREKEGDDAFHPSIEYFLGNMVIVILFVPEL